MHSNGLFLTDPAINSRRVGEYGLTDMGPSGIAAFFRSHECNQYCKSNWLTPRAQDTRGVEPVPESEQTSWTWEMGQAAAGARPRYAPPPTIPEYSDYYSDEDGDDW